MTREEQIHEIANTISTNIGKEVDEDYICNDEYDFTIGFECGAKWADENPNTEDIETVLAYTYKGLGWLAENIEFDMGTTGERALACIETLQLICNRCIMELCKAMEE